jgi:hypothetical protein
MGLLQGDGRASMLRRALVFVREFVFVLVRATADMTVARQRTL